MGYSKYIVTWIDVLGTKERSKNFDESKKVSKALIDVNNMIQEFIPNGRDTHLANYEQKIVRFSDTIIIFSTMPEFAPDNAKLKKHYSNNGNFHSSLVAMNLWTISLVQSIFFLKNILVRGAITVGEAYCDEESGEYFGPAFIKAIKLESKEVIYPRVIIDPDLVKYEDLFTSISIEAERFNTTIKGSNGPLLKYRSDSDGKYFIDYLSAVQAIITDEIREQKYPIGVYKQGINNIIKKYNHDNSLLESLLDPSDSEQRIKEKYSWLMEKMKKTGLSTLLNED